MKQIELTTGEPVPEDYSHEQIDPRTGQQKGYVVLSDEERLKGFVRPVRDSYRHIGPPGPQNPLRDLTEDEKDRYKEFGYIKFEAYPEDSSCLIGRFWTQEQLNRVENGCNTVTKMGQSLAETYARDPRFYSGTFCCSCGTHFPVEEFVWDDGERLGT